MSVELNPMFADCEVDVRHLSFNEATKEITQCMIGVAPGCSIEVIVSDTQTADDLAEWAATAGHRVLGTAESTDSQRLYLERQY